MQYLIFSTRLSSDTDYIDAVNEGAYFMTLQYNVNEPQTNAEYKNMDSIFSWWKISGTTARGRLPIKLTNPGKVTVNKYTLDCSTPTVYGDRLFGITDSYLPVFNFTYTILTDLIFASFEFMKRNDLNLAKSFIQAIYLLSSVFGDNAMKQTKSPVFGLTPVEL